MRRSTTVATVLVGTLMALAVWAPAASAAPVSAAPVSTSTQNSYATVSGTCTFLTSVFVPTQGVRAWVGIDAHAKATSLLNPVVASSVLCRIVENGAQTGFTGPGEEWSATGFVKSLGLPSLTVCVKAVAYLLDGHIVTAPEQCGPFG